MRNPFKKQDPQRQVAENVRNLNYLFGELFSVMRTMALMEPDLGVMWTGPPPDPRFSLRKNASNLVRWLAENPSLSTRIRRRMADACCMILQGDCGNDPENLLRLVISEIVAAFDQARESVHG